MSLVEGVQVNTALLPILTDLTGKEVLVETKDGSQWVGLFACGNAERGSDLTFGLSWVYKKTVANSNNILPKKSETLEKMLFNYADIVSVSAHLNEEKIAKGFATDRDYHEKANGHLEEDLEIWECEEEGEEIESLGQMPDHRQRYQKNGGWSVDEMFNTNSQMGVQSTFAEDMSQYTTVEVKGSEEDRLRADKIAREIENSANSKFYSCLENDDDERDLDKVTTEEELEVQAKKGGQRNYNNNRNGRGGGGAGMNRRAEGLKGNDRRGSGQQSRYSQGGAYNQRNQYTQGKRNDDFGGEWNAPKEPGRKDNMGTTRVYENTNFKGGKVLLEQKSASQRAVDGKGGAIDKLKRFHDDFSNTFKQPKSDEKEITPTQSPSRPTGNAWNRGPPSSLLNSQSQSMSSSSATPTHSSPTPAEAQSSYQDVSDDVAFLNVADDSSKDSGNISNEAQDEKEEKNELNITAAGKKFSFNPNAPAFTPRQPSSTPTQVVPVQQQVPAGVPIGVPGSVQMQGGMPPPGMVVPGQPVMMQWQPQGFAQVPTGYQMYVPQQPMIGGPVPMSGPQQRGNTPASQGGGYGNQSNQRRNGPNQQGAAMMVPNGQWANQVVMPQAQVYYPYPNQQQFSGNPQMVAQGQQGMPPQMYQQQRYAGGPMNYMVPPGVQQPRFPTPQQGGHVPEANGQFQQGPPPSSANSTGPSSQPPTPGPQQQPPTVASPAQQPSATHSAGGRGSPAPPPAQQFAPQNMPPTSQSHMQTAYYPPQNMYMYGQQPGVIMYTGAGSMPIPGQVHQEGQHQPHHMDGAVMQGHQQYTPHDQYGAYMPPGGPGYYNQQPHQQQPMSRQNSIPQAVYNAGQGAPPPGMQSQGGSVPPAANPSSAPSSVAPQQQQQ